MAKFVANWLGSAPTDAQRAAHKARRRAEALAIRDPQVPLWLFVSVVAAFIGGLICAI